MAETLSGTKFKCASCKGTGIQPRSLKSRCFACRGKGGVKLESPAIQCPSCKGKGMALNSSILSCLVCRGLGVVEKAKSENDSSGDVIKERLGEITKRLQWVRKEVEGKEKEIKKRLEPTKPFVKEIKKERLWLKKLGNKIKRAWQFLWKK